ncbi:peptidylprolyl isomerase [Devosia sp.]|uniref:peptidylprolyl isomerase n=1 Tax=Devosia sp. TaxID=1871048 RepID=UPI003262F923
MLDSLRDFAKSWPGKAMGGLLLVGLAGFGINNVITSLGTTTVARVGNEEITTQEFLRAYQNRINQVANQFGRMPTADEAVQLGLPSQVIGELSQNAALDQVAASYGLGVSDDRLGKLLREDNNFSGTLGNFDPAVFKDVLKRSGITEADYFESQAKSSQRQQLVLSLLGDTALPTTAANLINRYVGDKRTVDYFVIDQASVETPPAPTEDELATYLKAHQTEFRTVETRSVQILALSPQTLAKTQTVTDEQVAAEYEKTKASLTKPETRTIQQVVLNDAQIAAFNAGKTAGKSFDDLVKEAGLTVTEVGTFAKPAVTDAALAEAAFGLAQGDFAIIDGAAGKRAVHVSVITAGGLPTLADAKAGIAEALALTAAKADYGNVLDQIEELRAAFKPLSEIATRFKLPIYEVALTATGAELSVVDGLPENNRTKVADAVFKAQAGKLSPSVALDASTNLWFDLSKIDAARDQTLTEVHDAVATAWTNEKVDAAITAAAAKAVASLDAGTAIADVASSLSTFPQLSQPLGRAGEPSTPLDAAVTAAIFAGGPDHHGSAVSQAGEHVVFNVVEVTAAEGPLDAKALDSVSTDQRNDLYGDFITGIRDDAGLRINQQALSQALALNTGQ